MGDSMKRLLIPALILVALASANVPVTAGAILITAGGGGSFDTTADYGVDGTWRFKDTVRFTGATEFTYTEGDTYWTASNNGDSTGFYYSGDTLNLIGNVKVNDTRTRISPRRVAFETDLPGVDGGTGLASPFYLAIVRNGTYAVGDADANHPGVKSVTTADSTDGLHCVLMHNSMMIAGAETAEAVFKLTELDSLNVYAGFLDGDADGDPDAMPDVAGIRIGRWGATDGKVYGITSVQDTSTMVATKDTTATGYTCVADSWYHYRGYFNAAADTFYHQLWYCSVPDSFVWTESQTADLPTLANKSNGTDGGVIVWSRANGDKTSFFHLDYVLIVPHQPTR